MDRIGIKRMVRDIVLVGVAAVMLAAFLSSCAFLPDSSYFKDMLLKDEPADVVYTTRVEIVNEDVKIDPDTGEKYVVIRPDDKGERKYQILYKVYPDNATDKNVTFSYDTQNTVVTVDKYGVVTFSKKGAVIVEVIANDGSGAKDTIKIMAR